MDLAKQYKTGTFNHDFGYKEYITPHASCDPKRQILMREWDDYKNKPKQGKFKVTTKPIVCHFDEQAALFAPNPAPNRYHSEKKLPNKGHTSASLRKVDPKCTRGSHLDNMEAFEAKHKPPGVGKFDLTKYSDIGTKKHPTKKSAEVPRKFNNFDDGIKLAADVPGPGHFNPHVA